MSVYTVHEPPLRTADALAEPERFAFVRDGFYLWAFLLTPLWMVWRRLWLVLLAYLAVSLVLDTALVLFGASAAVVVGVGMLVSLLIGLEAGTFRRFTLRRRGWTNVGVVNADNLQDAERRFFTAWVHSPQAATSAPKSVAAAQPSMTAAAPAAPGVSSGVVGLFPEPGG
jgi:hypothetical protein